MSVLTMFHLGTGMPVRRQHTVHSYMGLGSRFGLGLCWPKCPTALHFRVAYRFQKKNKSNLLFHTPQNTVYGRTEACTIPLRLKVEGIQLWTYGLRSPHHRTTVPLLSFYSCMPYTVQHTALNLLSVGCCCCCKCGQAIMTHCKHTSDIIHLINTHK
jgi:hypothetical protein